jgi:hypothetical protein
LREFLKDRVACCLLEVSHMVGFCESFLLSVFNFILLPSSAHSHSGIPRPTLITLRLPLFSLIHLLDHALVLTSSGRSLLSFWPRLSYLAPTLPRTLIPMPIPTKENRLRRRSFSFLPYNERVLMYARYTRDDGGGMW